MAVNDKGLDPIEAQGDGRPESARGVYIHDASGNFLEALNQPQADGFLRMGFRLASPDEAKTYNKAVLARKEEAEDLNPVLEARRNNRTEGEQAILDAAYRKAVEDAAPKAAEQPKTVEDVKLEEQIAALSGEDKKDTSDEKKSETPKVSYNKSK